MHVGVHLPYSICVHNLCLQEFIKDGKRSGNIVFAPISLSVGLGVLYLGAKGSSKDEISKVSRRVAIITLKTLLSVMFCQILYY